MDHEFASSFTVRDKKKSKDTRQKSTESKIKSRKRYHEKFDQLHKDQMKDAKSGKRYGSGIALEAAKKQAKEIFTAEHNPKGIPRKRLRCLYYYPPYCIILGYNSCRLKEYGVRRKTAIERGEIMKNLNKVEKEEKLTVVLQEAGT